MCPYNILLPLFSDIISDIFSIRFLIFIKYESRIILVMFQLLLALQKVYGSHHDIVNRYEMSLSQMTKDMFPLS